MEPQPQAKASARLASDIMTRNPITLSEEDSVWTLHEEMRNLGLHYVPIVDGRKFTGLLSYQDLLKLTPSRLHRDSVTSAIELKDEREHFVADFMRRDVPTVSPDTTVQAAAKLMLSTRAGCLPVVQNDKTLVGIITAYDFIQLLVSTLAA